MHRNLTKLGCGALVVSCAALAACGPSDPGQRYVAWQTSDGQESLYLTSCETDFRPSTIEVRTPEGSVLHSFRAGDQVPAPRLDEDGFWVVELPDEVPRATDVVVDVRSNNGTFLWFGPIFLEGQQALSEVVEVEPDIEVASVDIDSFIEESCQYESMRQ